MCPVFLRIVIIQSLWYAYNDQNLAGTIREAMMRHDIKWRHMTYADEVAMPTIVMPIADTGTESEARRWAHRRPSTLITRCQSYQLTCFTERKKSRNI